VEIVSLRMMLETSNGQIRFENDRTRILFFFGKFGYRLSLPSSTPQSETGRILLDRERLISLLKKLSVQE